MDPGKNRVTMNKGQKGGRARLMGCKVSSQLATVEAARCSWGRQKNRRTGSVRHQDFIMHRICIIVHVSLL